MTVAYHDPNQVVTPIVAALPDVVSLLKQVILFIGTWYTVTDLANIFFYISVYKAYKMQFSSAWQIQQYTFTVLPQGKNNSSVLCHKLVLRNFDHLVFIQAITLVHYIDDIMLNGPSEGEVAITPDSLVRHPHIRE